MTSYGRQHTMSALIITGNGNGLGGYAIGKAGLKHHIRAIVNGMKMASRKLVYVELLENRTIYQDFYAECRGTRIFAQRRPKGFGVVAHPRLTKICEVILSVLGNFSNVVPCWLSFMSLLQIFKLLCLFIGYHSYQKKNHSVRMWRFFFLLYGKHFKANSFQVLGIKDLECKVVGSTRNYIALTHAFFIGEFIIALIGNCKIFFHIILLNLKKEKRRVTLRGVLCNSYL